MKILAKQWRKIYLFYGAVFFSLGFLGLIGSVDLWAPLSSKTTGYLDKLRMYSDLPQDDQMAVTVFESRYPDEVFLFYDEHEDALDSEILKQTRSTLSGFFQKTVLVPVHTNRSLPEMMLRSEGIIVKDCIGLNRGVGEMTVFFNLRKASEAQLLEVISRYSLPKARLQRVTQGQRVLFRLSWAMAPDWKDSDFQLFLTELLELGRSANATKI